MAKRNDMTRATYDCARCTRGTNKPHVGADGKVRCARCHKAKEAGR